jgi:hypothetical protein
MKKYLDIMKFKTRYQAKKACPWACKITKCYMGWMAFQTIEDYANYKTDITILNQKKIYT